MKKFLLSLTILFVTANYSNAQNAFPASGSVGIGTTSPASSSLLEVKSTTKGVLFPRMTSSQRGAISSPATGLLVFQTDGTRGFYYYEGGWKPIGSSASGSLNRNLSNLTAPTAVNIDILPNTANTINLGSAGSSWKDVFLGGYVYMDGRLFMHNKGREEELLFGSSSIGVGYNALSKITSGLSNTAVGGYALYNDTSGSYNTANGYRAMYNNSRGSYNTATGYKAMYNNTRGDFNTALGHSSLYSNENGGFNSAFGYQSLYSNTFGSSNTALGYSSLHNQTTGNANTAVGRSALADNITGDGNSGFGTNVLRYNQDGYYNTATGYGALPNNITGSYNTAVGGFALLQTISDNNTGVGRSALESNTSGVNNTAVGANTNVNANNYSNSTAIGYQGFITASNQVRIGNSFVTSIGGKVGWTTLSDGRYKKNMKDNVPGLTFIKALKPVTYTLDITGLDIWLRKDMPKTNQDGKLLHKETDDDVKAKAENEKIVYTGFVAQDVEKAAKEIGYDFNGVDVPKNDRDVYGLRYAEFVVPLVKAVQELDATNKIKDERITKLENELSALRQMVTDLNRGNINQQTSLGYLQQNMPNPFSSSTVIGYYVPENSSFAKLVITSMNGQTLKTISLNKNGNGQVSINGGTLASGTYNYNLWIDGKHADAKQLILTK